MYGMGAFHVEAGGTKMAKAPAAVTRGEPTRGCAETFIDRRVDETKEKTWFQMVKRKP